MLCIFIISIELIILDRKAPIWFGEFNSLYAQFSRAEGTTSDTTIFPTIVKRLDRTEKQFNCELENAIKFCSACTEIESLETYYKMWTQVFKLRWTIPLLNDKGSLVLSLKLPHFGFPPYAFVDSKSDPMIQKLRKTNWYFNDVFTEDESGPGHLADDILQATALQRYLFGDNCEDLTSLIKFSVRIHLNPGYLKKVYDMTPPNGMCIKWI